MTKSIDDLRENLAMALRLIMECLPDGDPYYAADIDADVARFSEVYPTTWRELERRGCVKLWASPGNRYDLTPDGWIEGLRATGEFYGEETKEKAARLAAALKARIKGRRQDGWVHLTELPRETGLPEGWIFNAIDSHLVFHLFGCRDARWEHEEGKNLIHVPLDFGLPCF